MSRNDDDVALPFINSFPWRVSTNLRDRCQGTLITEQRRSDLECSEIYIYPVRIFTNRRDPIIDIALYLYYIALYLYRPRPGPDRLGRI
ncbi:hypothetical protein KI387_041244, partial [Taxus chinensis]